MPRLDSARGPALRILFCTLNYFPVAMGGAERQARLQAEELLRRGHAVTVVCPRMGGAGDADIAGVQVKRLRVPHVFTRIAYLAALAWFLVRRGRSFDVIHVHLAALQADVAVTIGRLIRRPVYVKIAGGGASGEVTRLSRVARVTRWTGMRHATVIQALSSEIETELAGIGVRSERVVSIPNGIDVSSFQPATPEERAVARVKLGLPAGSVLTLYAGRFASYRGVLDLLDVWRAGAWGDAMLVLVGAGETHYSVVDQVQATADVVVRGWTSSPLDYLHACDVFVNPTHSDGMSNALLEAMACGLAVVASRAGAASAMIEDGRSGLLFPAGDRVELSGALSRVTRDAGLRAQLGTAAEVAARRFSISGVVDDIEASYRRIASRR